MKKNFNFGEYVTTRSYLVWRLHSLVLNKSNFNILRESKFKEIRNKDLFINEKQINKYLNLSVNDISNYQITDENCIGRVIQSVIKDIEIRFIECRYKNYMNLLEADLRMMYSLNGDMIALEVLFLRCLDVLEFQIKRLIGKGISEEKIEELWCDSFIEAINNFDMSVTVSIRNTTNLIFINKIFNLN